MNLELNNTAFSPQFYITRAVYCFPLYLFALPLPVSPGLSPVLKPIIGVAIEDSSSSVVFYTFLVDRMSMKIFST